MHLNTYVHGKFRELTLASSSSSSDKVWARGCPNDTKFLPDFDSSAAATSCSTTEERYCEILRMVRLNRPNNWVLGSSSSAANSSAVLYCNPIPIKIVWKKYTIVKSSCNSWYSCRCTYQLNRWKVSVTHGTQAIDFGDIRQQVHDKMIIGHVAGIILEPLKVVLT